VHEIERALAGLELRSTRDKRIPIDVPRNILRRAAALLCSGREVQPSIVSHLVNIPFQLFTIESINMGISLWLGVIHENPKTESRTLVEVAQAWERTIRRKQGIFNPSFK
jgi:phosphatidylinositol 4-kinase